MRILVVLLLAAMVAAEQKREAEPSHGYSGYHGRTHGYQDHTHGYRGNTHGYYGPHGHSYGQHRHGVARHYGGGTSYVGPTLHGVGKREADPGNNLYVPRQRSNYRVHSLPVHHHLRTRPVYPSNRGRNYYNPYHYV
ncbi:uncharacterized protein LOC121862987 [Homarus americanus]|uniref:uncharacterized protein LOC121862987 n=1 Tax=Homarus americanus TaxID=6706 RepID=UPI001C43AA3A|nr:uncharacterized protein LOC121862987 [Homarus americanus]